MYWAKASSKLVTYSAPRQPVRQLSEPETTMRMASCSAPVYQPPWAGSNGIVNAAVVRGTVLRLVGIGVLLVRVRERAGG